MKCHNCGCELIPRVSPKGRQKRLSAEEALTRVTIVHKMRVAGKPWKQIAYELGMSDAGLFNWMGRNSHTDLEGMEADIAEREKELKLERIA